MKTLRFAAVVAAALAGSSLAASPTWAKTAFQYWAQGRGAYVSSKDHPPELYQFFEGVAAADAFAAPYGDPYGGALPPPYPYYGAPGY